MSSVLVKGMKMPDSCAVCRFAGRGGYFMERIVCMFTGENEDAENVDRLPDCPLVALPDHHGRLKDTDELIEFVEDRYEITWESDCYEGGIKDACTDILEKINTMPTIVEAEGGT